MQKSSYLQQHKEKKSINQNQGWEPIHENYKATENTSKHNPKKKTKANNQQKSSKNPMQKELMAMKWQWMITKNI